MTRERRLNDFLLAVTKSIFQELLSMDAVNVKNYGKEFDFINIGKYYFVIELCEKIS